VVKSGFKQVMVCDLDGLGRMGLGARQSRFMAVVFQRVQLFRFGFSVWLSYKFLNGSRVDPKILF
jgi:hypothetical protein